MIFTTFDKRHHAYFFLLHLQALHLIYPRTFDMAFSAMYSNAYHP